MLIQVRFVVDAKLFNHLDGIWLGAISRGLIIEAIETLAVFVLMHEDIEHELHGLSLTWCRKNRMLGIESARWCRLGQSSSSHSFPYRSAVTAALR